MNLFEQRSSLSADELELLELFRTCDANKGHMLLTLAHTLADRSKLRQSKIRCEVMPIFGMRPQKVRGA